MRSVIMSQLFRHTKGHHFPADIRDDLEHELNLITGRKAVFAGYGLLLSDNERLMRLVLNEAGQMNA